MTEALMIAKREHLFIPLHNQPMAWAMRSNIATMPSRHPTTSRASG
jgi:peptide/nickel transport system substrate-binding protein